MTPSDAEVEACLRKVVHSARRADEEISVNVARQRAQEELWRLPKGYLKNNERWKSLSKEIVQSAFEEELDDVSSVTSPIKEDEAKTKPQPNAGVKRKAQTVELTKKRRKQSAVKTSDDESLSEADEAISRQESESAHESDEFIEDDLPQPATRKPKGKIEARKKPNNKQPTVKSTKSRKKHSVVAESDDEAESEQVEDDLDEDVDEDSKSVEHAEDDTTAAADQKNKVEIEDDGSDSDMSVLIDDPPPKRARQKKAASSEPASKGKGKAQAKPAKDLPPDQEEIKRLQGWLVKCGLRKVWSRELAPYSTSKEKIRHLKKLLESVGMTGRYSAEKAKSIKEARELQAEIESAQEFNQVFGHKGSDDEEDDRDDEEGKTTTRPRRALPKGFIDFGDSGDDGSD